MALINTNHPTAFGTRIGTGLIAVFAPLHAAYAAWTDARNSRKTLGALPDFLLNDIGLTRSDVDQISR